MKKTIIFSCLAIFLYAQDDYVPLSELSNAKKLEYNFVDKKKKIETPKIEEYKTTKIEESEYETVTSLKEEEIKEQIIENDENIEKVEQLKEEKKIVNKEFVEDYKNDNILQDVKKNKETNKKDFSITPKLSYFYVNTELTDSNNSIISDKTSEVLPEISLLFRDHTIKAELLKSSAEDKDTNLKLDTSWYKISYLYEYSNVNIGLAYNQLKFKEYTNGTDKEVFPSIEFHLENQDDRLIAQYGISLGSNNNIDYAYEYYLNLGYKLIKNDGLILSAGYKNKTIEDDTTTIEYKGPTISISGNF